MNPVSSLFHNIVQAFDEASRADQQRMAEQTHRLAQQRQARDAEAATAQARVEVQRDGFAPPRPQPVALGQGTFAQVRRVDAEDRVAKERLSALVAALQP